MSAQKEDDDLLMALRAGDRPNPTNELPLDDGLLLAFRAGTLSPVQTEELERRLARDPEARALLRELSQDVAPAEVDAVLARLSPPVVVPLRPRRRPALWASAVVALAAGLLAVVFAWPPHAAARYLLEVEGAEASTRGAAHEKTVVGDEGRLTLRLRAEKATDAPRALCVFVEDAGGRLTEVPAARVSSARGSFEVRLDGAAWLGAPGAHRVWLHVGETGVSIAALAGRLQRDVAGEGLGWWALDVERRP